MKIRHEIYAATGSQPLTKTSSLTVAGPMTLTHVTVSTNAGVPLNIKIYDGGNNEGWNHFVSGSIDWHGSQQLGWDGIDNAYGFDTKTMIEGLPQGKHCFVEFEYSKI